VAIGMVAGLVVFMAAGVSTWRWHAWFDWLVISEIQVPTAITWALVFHTQRVLREKRRLEEGLLGGAATRRTGQRRSRPTDVSHGVAEPAARQMAERMRDLQPPASPPESSSGSGGQPAPTRVPIPDHTLLRQIGAGAYGEVWLARNVMGSYRGVTIVYRDRLPEGRPYEREFDGTMFFEPISRSHPGLMQILHVGRNDEDGYFYYLVELADDMAAGTEFRPETYEPKTLTREIANRGRLPAEQCIEIGCSLTDALTCLHGQGLVHRDIKPSNIIFVGGRPKLADIGLVTEVGEDKSWVGTMGYIPPEGPGTPMADVYGLGKVLYQASTGMACRQFPELPTDFDRQTDAGFEGLNLIILKACEEDFHRRYASAREMQDDLLRLATRLKKKRRWIRGRSAH
jgi:serine/threonine protein kinase